MVADSRPGVAVLTRLRKELAEDREAMGMRVSDIVEARPHLAERQWRAHAAVAIHAWYTGFESAMDRALRVLDGEVPGGERWHRERSSGRTA